MKRKQVNKILSFQTRRRKNVFLFILGILITFLISSIFLIAFITGNKLHYVKYTEENKSTYKVYLKENEFFNNNYLEKDNEYISSLIEQIEANFNYELSVEEKVTYKYTYKVESEVYVKRKGSVENLYKDKQILLNSIHATTNDTEIKIDEQISIDYNTYNNLMKKFVNIYGLDDIESILTVNMYVNVLGECDSFAKTANKESIISVKIPLTTRVVDVELSDNLMSNENNLIECKKTSEVTIIYIVLALVFIIVCLIITYKMIKYIVKTRTAENIYQKKLKKILNNYGSYIQTLGNNVDFTKYQMLHINTFEDMLEISETISQPILMKENSEKTGAYFLILTNSKVVYVYRLKVETIEEDLKKERIKNK